MIESENNFNQPLKDIEISRSAEQKIFKSNFHALHLHPIPINIINIKFAIKIKH